MKVLTKKAFMPIDQYEKNLLESIENDEWIPVGNVKYAKSKPLPPRETL